MTDLATTPVPDMGAPGFWARPLAERMHDLGAIREADPFTEVPFESPLTGEADRFLAVTRYADVVAVSRDPKTFCSGQGSVSIPDMPPDITEYFGSFITLDDPRHARQRGIVSRSFTPKRLAAVLESVETICTEVVDDMCERGEADLVDTISAPFPLLVICDMMGIPRSQFDTVLHATNVILGAGDAEMLGGKDPMTALLEAGMTLTALMQELADERRSAPRDDLTSALVHNDLDAELMTPDELAAFFILLAVAGNDTTRTATTLGVQLLSEHPDQRRRLLDDLEGPTMATAVEEIVRMASPVTYMRRTVTEPVHLSGRDLVEGDKLVLFYGVANRDPRVFDDPETFDVTRDPNPHIGFGGPGPHFCLGAHLARRELAVILRQLYTRLPDLELAGPPEHLEPMGVPLVGGVKRLPVRFTPAARST